MKKVIAVDTETTGLHFWKDKIFGLSVSYNDVDQYWDIRRTNQSTLKRKLKDSMDKADVVVFHNAKFDIHFLREWGVDVPVHKTEDTMIRAALIDEHRLRYDLDSLGKDIVGMGKVGDIYEDLAAMFGGRATRNAQMKNLHRAPPELVAPYAKRDTRVTLKLWEAQEIEIEKQDLHQVHQLEKEVLPVLVDMEKRGVKVDIDEAEKAIKICTTGITLSQRQLDGMAGFKINPNPSGSIHKLFKPKQNENGIWTLIDGTVAPSTGAGKASINADVLRDMKHPAAALILEIRKMHKMRDTFLKGHILGHHDNGIIHANFNQTKGDNDAGTGTGRLSVNGPALQQIPKRDKKIASVVRSIFLPDSKQYWSCIDWQAMDFRIFAHYLDDPKITKIFKDNPEADFHQITADITGLPRSPRYSGEPNCFDGETEFLSEYGWKKISEYAKGEKVGQYIPGNTVDELGKVNFVEPIDFITGTSDKMFSVRNGDMLITKNHRLLYWRRSGYGPFKIYDHSVGVYSNMSKNRQIRIPTSWIEERNGMDLNDPQLKLSVALQADGSMNESGSCRFGLKLTRKIKRLKDLLKEAEISYFETEPNKDGVVTITFKPPIASKSFGDKIWFLASVSQRKIIIDEMCHWDGHSHSLGYKVFYSTDKKSADYIHWAASSIGMRSSMYHTNDEYRTSFNAPDPKRVWQVRCGLKKSYSLTPKQIEIEYGVKKVYCFTLSSGFLPVRRNGRVYISGQSKQINLGLVFGMGSGTMADKMNLPYTIESFETRERGKVKKITYKKPGPEAMGVFNKYHSAIPGVKSLLDRAASVAKSRGYVKTVMGRRLRFPGGQYSHKAGGLIFQGSAADALKVKMVEIYKMLKGTEGRLLLNVHDEFDCSLPKGMNLDKEIREIMHEFGPESTIHFKIPIRSSYGRGKNWWKAC